MSFRGFLAVEVDPPEPLGDLQRELDATGADLNLVDLENLHVTMRFLGDTPEDRVPGILEAMEQAVADAAPRTLHVEGVGVFPHLDHIRVLWAGFREADGAALAEVAERLEKGVVALGFDPEGRDFHPHVTLARMKSARSKDRVQDLVRSHEDEPLGTVAWERLVLMRSELGPGGPTYSVVDAVPLEA